MLYAVGMRVLTSGFLYCKNKHQLQCLKQVLGCEPVYNLFSKNQYSELPLDDLLAVDNIQTVDGLGYTLATQVMVFDV